MLGLTPLLKCVVPDMPTGPILSIFEVMILAGVVVRVVNPRRNT